MTDQEAERVIRYYSQIFASRTEGGRSEKKRECMSNPKLYTELRVSNGKIWRPRFESDARRDDEAVVDALRQGEATPQQAKDRSTKFSLLMRSSVVVAQLEKEG